MTGFHMKLNTGLKWVNIWIKYGAQSHLYKYCIFPGLIKFLPPYISLILQLNSEWNSCVVL